MEDHVVGTGTIKRRWKNICKRKRKKKDSTFSQTKMVEQIKNLKYLIMRTPGTIKETVAYFDDLSQDVISKCR